MPDLKRIIAGAIDATKNIKSVYEKLVDLGDGTYAQGVALTGSGYQEVTLQNASANGDGAAMTVTGYGAVGIQISGTFSATVNFEGTVDGTNFVAILAQNKNTGGQTTTATAPGIFVIPVSGLKQIRARVSGYVSGIVTVKALAIPQSLSDLASATISATVDAVKIKDATGTNTLNIQADGSAPVALTGSNVTDTIISNIDFLVKNTKRTDDDAIYGVRWDKASNPILTRTDAAVGLVANAGVGFGSVVNDFDNRPIFGEIEDVYDTLGNVFVRIPKFYIRKMDGLNFKTWQVSKRRYPGFYLPWCFWDFTNNKELEYIDVGKYKASKSGASKLESIANVFPLRKDHIVNFRTFATNNNADGLLGYQQLDIHVVDVLRTLMIIEFATLNIQTIMQGWTAGQYSASHVATVAELAANRIIVSNDNAALYVVGQPISLGTTLGGDQIATDRTIISIDVYDASNKAIVFDGAAVDIALGNIVYNSVWKNGFSLGIAASSGSLVANDGKSPCVYRGIESPFGDMWQFVDGVNINENQAWVAKNAAQYASNVFASPYEQLSYVNHNANGYVAEMGFDANNPFAELATSITGADASKYYCDYYYQSTGQRIARFGGYWNNGATAGLSCWSLDYSSSLANLNVGGRLVKKPL